MVFLGGVTCWLTTGTDTIEGTASNDIVKGTIAANATQTTLSSADTIDGAGGNDTLEMTIDTGVSANSVTVPTVTNVETISVRNVSGNNQTVNANNFTGETGFVADRSSSNLTFDNIGTSDLTIKGNGSVDVANVTATVGAASVTDAFTLNVTGGVVDATGSNFYVDDTNADWTEATINSANGKNTLDDVNLSGLQATASTHTVTGLTINAESDLTVNTLTGFAADATVTITGAGKVDLDANAIQTNVDSIDASGNTGGVMVALDNENNTKFTGGSGADKVTTGSVAYVAANSAAINAGDGVDTLAVNNNQALSTAASGAKFTNFEVLEVNTNATIDMDNIAGITSLVIDNAAGVDLNDVSAEQAGNITVQQSVSNGNAIDLAVKGADTVGQIDTLSITTDDGLAANNAVNLRALTSSDVEKLELTAKESTTITSLTNISDVNSIIVGGDKATSIYTGALAANINTTVNASAATGALTFDAAASTTNGFSVTGGSKADTIVMASTDLKDTIVGGAGDDTIYANGATAEQQTVTYTAAPGGTADTIDVTVGGVTVTTATVANNATANDIADAVTAALQANAELANKGYTFVDNGANNAGEVIVNAPASAGDIAAATTDVGNLTVTPAVVEATKGGVSGNNAAADTITGGEGNDTIVLSTGGAVTTIDTIKDLNLGDNTASGTVDQLVFSGIGAGTTEALINLTSQQQDSIDAAGQTGGLAGAVDAVFAAAGTDGNVAQFTFDGGTYIAVNGDGNGTYNAGADLVVNVTGVTGTLDLNDFSFA